MHVQPIWAQVSSSNIVEIAYPWGEIEHETMQLRVRFKNGFVYHFEDIPKALAYQFLNASSKGKFFHSRIKNAFAYSAKYRG